eukprot:SAG31_NODE_2656_length_5289_cov_1.990366_4_plen_83_part_00
MAAFKPDAAAAKRIGLNFYAMMERLMLLRIGKSTLSYQQQMEEQDAEQRFVREAQFLTANFVVQNLMLGSRIGGSEYAYSDD